MHYVYMTKNELNVLKFIDEQIKSTGVSPTYKEIQENFGLASIGSVQSYIRQLEKKGLIEKHPKLKRSLKVIHNFESGHSKPSSTPDYATLPVLGSVAAGLPLEKKEHDEYMDVPLQLISQPDKSFVLRVSGDSMIEAGIFDKDLLLIESCNYADSGSIVVAATQDEAATVKKIFYKNSTVELRPANAKYESQFYKGHEISIKGKVVGLIRRYLK